MSALVQAVISSLYADPEDHACRSRYIRLAIYRTADDLRAAGNRHHRRRAIDDDLTDCEGLFQPSPWRSRYNRRTRQWDDTTGAYAGAMRLTQTRLTPEVVAHESTHAALHIWRLHQWAQDGRAPDADFGDSCGPTEEAFAYLLGGIASEVANIVHRVRS